METLAERVTVEIGFSPDVFVAMQMIGLEGESLASEMKRITAIDFFRRGLLSDSHACPERSEGSGGLIGQITAESGCFWSGLGSPDRAS